jgi:hypothetical protein
LPANIVIFSHFAHLKTQKFYFSPLFYSFEMGYNGIMVGQIDIFIDMRTETFPVVGVENMVYTHPDSGSLIGPPEAVAGLYIGVGEETGHGVNGVGDGGVVEVAADNGGITTVPADIGGYFVYLVGSDAGGYFYLAENVSGICHDAV